MPDAPMVRFHKSYRQAIDANQPLVLTYSLDEASAKGMQASFLSQERVSVVGVGYDITSPEPYVIALLPEESNRDQKLQRLIALPGAALDKQGRLLRLPWNLLSGNLIATFIEVAP